MVYAVPVGADNGTGNVLGANYRDRVFAYPKDGMLTVIAPSNLRLVADELITLAFAKIRGRVALTAMVSAPGLSIRSDYPDDDNINASGWAMRR